VLVFACARAGVPAGLVGQMDVLDASALLAYLRDEPGAQTAADTIAGGAAISAVNLAEVFSSATDRGADPALLADDLTRHGLLGGALVVEDFTTADALPA